mmetsp:Transcript_19792/g.36486  ORF Transcript_19792/g.36486 Transcript_19792/m.36486 type:complete len:100 (-) Transcript_19792:8765-9064(-)
MKPPKEGWTLQESVSAKLSELILIQRSHLLECLLTDDMNSVLCSSINEAAGEMCELELENAWLRQRLRVKQSTEYMIPSVCRGLEGLRFPEAVGIKQIP